MSPEREFLLDLFDKALASVDPEAATRRIAPQLPTLPDQAVVVAIGKGAAAMARGVAGWSSATAGVVTSDHADPVPAGLQLLVAGHPVPDERSLAAGAAAREMAAQPADMTLFLISGGASALCEQPADGLGLDDIIAVNRLLLSVAAPIDEVNTVRKHLSAIKGGRLGVASPAPHRITLAVSDVVGADIAVIGSGPSVPDPTTFGDALSVLDRYGLADRVPAPSSST